MSYGLEIFTGLSETQIDGDTTTLRIHDFFYAAAGTNGTKSIPGFDINDGFIAETRGRDEPWNSSWSWDNANQELTYDISSKSEITFAFILAE